MEIISSRKDRDYVSQKRSEAPGSCVDNSAVTVMAAGQQRLQQSVSSVCLRLVCERIQAKMESEQEIHIGHRNGRK